MGEELKFTDKILDNVHGFIHLTEAESKIIDTPIFKRLQSIKQLSLINWIFPGSEHTRFSHSLGVMHIADKIARRLDLSLEERKLLRFAGLLHDIGHYPLSHVCEIPYKIDTVSQIPIELNEFSDYIQNEIIEKINKYIINDKSQYMESSFGYHHEEMGCKIINNVDHIKKIIEEEFGEKNAVEKICNIIRGNVDIKYDDCEKFHLLVQIMHSELDADGIDYMLRDSVYSGTSFGSFEIDHLINCMEKGKYNEKYILCINYKAIAAADQYLINKFFTYSQIIFNKHSCILEKMTFYLITWMIKNEVFFPSKEKLDKWISTDINSYLSFTDSFFWESIKYILENPLNKYIPKHIKSICEKLIIHKEFNYIKNSEIKIISNNKEEIIKKLRESKIYSKKENNNILPIFSERCYTKQIDNKKFEIRIFNDIFEKYRTDEQIFKDKYENFEDFENRNKDYKNIEDMKKDIDIQREKRFMECICVVEDENINVLCDDVRSLCRNLQSQSIVILRCYDLNI